MKNKSLLIVALPRSASTSLERVCSTSLKHIGFQRMGEFLNPSFKNYKRTLRSNLRSVGGISNITQYTTSIHYEKMCELCENFKHNYVIRDVVQTPFICKNIEWLKKQFNIIYLERPIEEVIICCKWQGWIMPEKKYLHFHNMLTEIEECESFVKLDYYDFVLDDSHKITKILQRWYPKVKKIGYFDNRFMSKRNASFKTMQKRIGQVKKYHTLSIPVDIAVISSKLAKSEAMISIKGEKDNIKQAAKKQAEMLCTKEQEQDLIENKPSTNMLIATVFLLVIAITIIISFNHGIIGRIFSLWNE